MHMYQSKNTSFKGDYDSINYAHTYGHDIEIIHAIQVKHNRQMKAIEDSTRHTLIEAHFNQEQEDDSLVIHIDKEIDILF